MLRHLLSVAEVHVLFTFSQSDCILCMSAVPVLHKGYSLVLLFVVRLDSFVSCCNSYAADNAKRLTGVTKLCCSWLSVRGEANQTFCRLGQEVGLSWNKWESCSSAGSHNSEQLRSQALVWKYNICDYFFWKYPRKPAAIVQGQCRRTENRTEETILLVSLAFGLSYLC